MGIQRDPKYYPKPNEFDPSRFDKDNVKSFIEMPYMPFGEGPRICIGARLGRLQTKLGLMYMLKKYKYEVDAHHVHNELQFSPQQLILTAEKGINLKIKHR